VTSALQPEAEAEASEENCSQSDVMQLLIDSVAISGAALVFVDRSAVNQHKLRLSDCPNQHVAAQWIHAKRRGESATCGRAHSDQHQPAPTWGQR
jgi:hypothetical protein